MATARAKRAGTVTGPDRAGHSGRLLLRMDPALHAELARAAEREGQSLNAYITSALGDELDGGRPQAEDGAAGRLLRAAVIADLVLVAIAAAIAIALLVIAWPT